MSALSVLILIAVVIVAVIACAYTFARINQMAAATAAKNEAVKTSADVAELLAASDSADAFVGTLAQNYPDVRQIDDSHLQFGQKGLSYRLRLKKEPRENGTMLVLRITARQDHQKIYTLQTKKFCKNPS